MAVGDFYRVLLSGQANEIACQSQLWFRQMGGGNPAANDLLDCIVAEVLPILAACMSDFADFRSVRVYNHNNPTDFVEDDSVFVAGTITGSPAPSVVSQAFTQPRKRTDMRAGQQRLWGVPESATDGNVFAGSYNTAADAAADILSAVLDCGFSTFARVIVRRILETTEDGKTYYVVPATISSSDYYFADSWRAVRKVSHQVSRGR